MREHIIFQNCPDPVKERVEQEWSKITSKLERLLQKYPRDQRHLRLVVRHKNGMFDARAVLMLPTGTLVAHTHQPTNNIREALDVVEERLRREIHKHKEKVRREHLYRRKRRHRESLESAIPLLEEEARAGEQESFFAILRPLIRHLRTHVHYELTLAQLDGRIKPGECTVSDILDEVIARAYDRFLKRPQHLSLERWLVEILHEVIDERSSGEISTVSVYDPLPENDPRFEVENGWIVDNEPFWGNPEPITLEDTLPGSDIPESWQNLMAEEQRRWLLNQLRQFPLEKRRAFTLHFLEGWDVAEIALLQDRSAEEVQEDVQTIAEELTRRLQTEQTISG